MKSNVELKFEAEFEVDSPCQSQVLLNQGRKVANLSDRGKVLPSDVCVECFLRDEGCLIVMFDIKFCVTGAVSRLKRFPLSLKPMGSEGEEPASSLKPMGSGCSTRTQSRSVCVVIWSDAVRRKRFPLSIKPMGSGCASNWVFRSEVVVCVPPLHSNSNFSEEFESGGLCTCSPLACYA